MIKIENVSETKMDFEAKGSGEELSYELCVIIDKIYKLVIKEVPNRHNIPDIIGYVDSFIKPALLMIGKDEEME